MKKIAALLLILCLLAAGPCGLAEAPDDGIPGVWVMTRLVADGVAIDNPAARKSSKIFLFSEDGSAVVTINKDVYNASWTLEGDVIHLLYEDGDKAEIRVEPDQLVYETASQTQYFTRQIIYADGSDFSYHTLADGTAEIIGYSGEASALNIPAEIDGYPVSVIGTAAFASKDALISVTVPASVTVIKPFAFRGCAKLARVSLPKGLTRIGASAFQNCRSLSGISIPEGVKTIEYEAFSGCRSLAAVSLPEGLDTIEMLAFAGCESLTGISLPEGLKTLADAAFSGCAALESVSLPASLTAIYGAPFAGCEQAAITAPSGSYAAEWLAQR